jgi:hypothetical protein
MFFLLHGVMMMIPEVAVEVEAARPACERGIIYRTPEVESTERALRWGLVAFVSSTRRTVSCAAAMAAIVERIPELEGRFSMHRFWPTDLLQVFDSRANRDVLLIASTNPFDGRDPLLWRVEPPASGDTPPLLLLRSPGSGGHPADSVEPRHG